MVKSGLILPFKEYLNQFFNKNFEEDKFMLEFFLALFGGLYYGAKMCNEKSQSRKADARNQEIINTLNRDFDTWIHRVTNEKLEYEIQFTSDSTINVIYNRIVTEAKIESVTPDMIIMGLLAQHGKIPKKIAERGIHSHGIWDYAEKLRWQEQRKFLLWYDKELQSHGINEPLMFVDGVNEHSVRSNISVATPISEGTKMIGGRYFWTPMRKNVY